MRRIYHISSGQGALAEWTSTLQSCVELGFDTLLLRLPRYNLFDDSIDPEVDLARVAMAANQAGLQLIVEASLGAVRAGSAEAERLGVPDPGHDARDPRRDPALKHMLFTPFAHAGKRALWLEAAERRRRALEQLGVSGVCFPFDGDTAGWMSAWASIRGDEVRARPFFWAFLAQSAVPAGIDMPGFVGAFLPAASLPGSKQLSAYAAIRQTFGELVLAPHCASPVSRPNSDETEFHTQLTSLIRSSALLADGVLVSETLVGAARERPAQAGGGSTYLTKEIAATNRLLAEASQCFSGTPAIPMFSTSAGALAARRLSHDGSTVRVLLANSSRDRRLALPAAAISREVGEYLPLRGIVGTGASLDPDETIELQPGEVRAFEGRVNSVISNTLGAPRPMAEDAVRSPRLVVEGVTPCVDNGVYPVKRIVGDVVTVEADVFGEGHDPIAVTLHWRAADEVVWREKRMRPLGNDRWAADFALERIGRYFYSIEAWRDEFAIFRSELRKKHEAGVNVSLEIKEGAILLQRAVEAAKDKNATALGGVVQQLGAMDEAQALATFLAPETAKAFAEADARPFKVRIEPAIPVDAERKSAAFASWYELFPRSQSGEPDRHGTFDDVIRRLPAIRDMGFDVIYFPPIHPIGRTNRKGRNNSLRAEPDDPGSPYAIGAKEGGHDAIHPDLGSFDDFARMLTEARALGLDVALDIAVQASPDHPWLKQHPEWFDWRPDGSIRYAENPPKKYEDIVNVDFYTEGATPSLWLALRDVLKFWVDQGITLFRIDNPHTKPFPFWDWAIADIRRDHPQVVFLAEAFTRPKIMYRLAKGGFSQSYTYFTWRNSKAELTAYFTELSTGPAKEFFRPHLFVNTPDINPDFLQNAPRSAYLIRAALATTLSGLWGMYNGFELCEGRPDALKKEYADSEKYQIRAWDWDRPGNIIAEISALNRIRHENPALHSHLGVSFLNAWNDNILFFEKASPDRMNVLLIAVNLDPYLAQEADVELPLWKLGLPDHGAAPVEDLVRGHQFVWRGKHQRIGLDPLELPFSIWRLG